MELNQDFSSAFTQPNSPGAGQMPAAAPVSSTPAAAAGLSQDFSSVFAPQQQRATTNPANTAKLDDVLASEGASALKPLVSAFYGQESSSGANAQTSVDGAQGGMQIMPATFAQYAKPGESINNAADNLAVGTRILADLSKRFNGDPAKIAVGYISGPGNVNTDPNATTPWKVNKADGNGTTVAQYVQGILSRLRSQAPAQPQQPDQPTAPDLSQAPKWTDVVTNPAFQKLSAADQQQTADAYFQKWIAPNVAPDQIPAMQAEWAQKSAEVMKQAQPPSLLSRMADGLQSGASALVNSGFATDNPAAPNAAVNQAPQQPNTAGVLGANNTPAAVAAASPANQPATPMMASPAMQQQVFQQFDAATPEQRQAMMQQPGMAGQLAQARAAQIDSTRGNPVTADFGTSVEDRTQRLVNAGVALDVARAQAQRDAASGATTTIPGDMKASTFDFDTAAQYRNANPLLRGAVQGIAGSAQSLVGIGRFFSDMTGAGNSDVAGWLQNAASNIKGTSDAIGQSANPLTRNLEAATSGVVQILPAMLGGAFVDGLEALPLAQNGLQMFGQSYSEGRDAGQDLRQATTRAGMMGVFAVLGHALGLDAKLEAIRQSVAGASNAALGESIWNSLARDLPSTQLMALGNFVTDKLPGGVGLAPEAKFTDWLQQAGDMFVQTAMMNGMLGAGAAAGAGVARLTGAPGTSANAPHQSSVVADNIVREMAAAHGLDASNVIPEPMPVPQPAGAPVAAAAPVMGDGRIEPTLAPAAQPPSVSPSETPGAAPEPSPMQASLAQSPTAQGEAATAGRPYDPQQVLDFAKERYDALLAKQRGTLEPTMTPGGHEDVEVPGQQLTPNEQMEWDALRQYANDPAAIAHFYGFDAPEPVADAGAPTPEQLDAAAHEAATSPKNELPEPTQAQKEAGNYQKGHVEIHGLDVTIENPQGSTRSGTSPDGVMWENTLQDHYGYIRRTVGADEEHVDTFVGPNPASRQVFIVDQRDPATGKFDEHKVMLGYDSMAEADAAYHRNYEDGWNGRAAISELPIGMFKEWLDKGDTRAPFARGVSPSMRSAGEKPTTEKEARTLREAVQPAAEVPPPKTEREAQARKQEKQDGSTAEAQGSLATGEARQEAQGADRPVAGTEGAPDGRADSAAPAAAGPERGNGSAAGDAAGAGRRVRPEPDGSGSGHAVAGDVKPKTEREAYASRLERIVGKVGDVVRASDDFDYVKAGKPMRIDRVEKHGGVRFVDPENTLRGTTVTRGAMERALRAVKFEKVEPEAPKPLDHGELNVPLAKRGDIDAQIDQYKAEQAAVKKTEARTRSAEFKADKARAKELFAEVGDTMIARHGEKLGEKELRKTLDSMVKWEPKKFIALAEKFAEEQATALHHSLARPEDDGPRFAAEALTELGANDELFQNPVSRSRDVVDVMRDIDPDIKYVGDATDADEKAESGAEQKLLFRTPQGHDFYVYMTSKDVWLDVSRLPEGGGGSAIYSAVANFAHNTKRVFIGDPAGLSDIALRRRTDNMLSSAIKFGTTDHLEPHPRQIEGDEKLGVPPLSWRRGDDVHNIRSMIDVSLNSLYHVAPEAKDVRYDFDTRTFRDGSDRRVFLDDSGSSWGTGVQREASSSEDRRAVRAGEEEPDADGVAADRDGLAGSRAPGVGRATLKRAALLASLVRSESGERPGLLESVLRQSSQHLDPALRESFYDANGEHPRLDASAFNRAAPLAGASEPDRTSALTTLKRLSARLDKGEITDAEFRLGAQNLLAKLQAKREGQVERSLTHERERGDLYIRERLLRAVRHGDIEHSTADFAQWLLDKNPAIADDLGISVRAAGADMRGSAGLYNSISRVLTLFRSNANVGTAVHEILHHTERMMPEDVRAGIYKAWAREWQQAYRDASPKQKPIFNDMLAAAVGDRGAWSRVAKAFSDGTLNYDDHYKLVNPSEYWAVKATDLLKSRYDARDSWIGRAKQWLAEMAQRVRSILKMPSDSPVLDGLRSVLEGDGSFQTRAMMTERTPDGVRDLAAGSHESPDQVALRSTFNDLAKSPTERADDSYERTRNIIDKSFDTKSTARTFNWLEKTFASQVHKAIKDPDFGRVFNAMRRMMNHTGLAATRPADLAPMIVPKSDHLRQAVKTLFAGKRVSDDIKGATRALLEGTLAGDNVTAGRTWTDKELRENYKLTDKGVEAYKQARAAIDASLDEVSAAEAWGMVHGLAPDDVRTHIVNDPTKAQSLIRGVIDSKLEMLTKAHDRAVAAGDVQKAEILHSLMMPYVETRKKVDDIFDKAEVLKSGGYLPLMRFGKYTVYAHKIDPETGLSARDAETGQPLVHYFGMFPTEAEAKHEHERQLALYRDDPTVQISRGVKSEKAHQLYEGLSPETLSLFADKVGADAAMQHVIQLALSERSALKRRLERRAISGFSDDLPRILSQFLTSNGRFAAQRLYMRDVNRAIQEIPKEKGDVADEAIKLKQFVLNGEDPGSRTMAGMFLWTMAGSPVSAAVVASEPFQKIFPYLSQFGVARASAGLGKALTYVLGRRQITDPELRAAMQRAAREGIIKPQEIFHLYDMGMENMSTWLSSQLAAHSGPGAALTKDVADGIRARATALSTMLGIMHSAAETFGRKMAFHAAWEVAKARGEKDPYAWTVRAIDEAGSQFGKINRSNIERTYAGRMMLAYKSFTLGWLGLLFRMARKGGVEGARGAAVMLATQMAMGGLQGLPFMQNFDDLYDTIGNFMGHNSDFARVKRQWAEKTFGKTFGEGLMHGLARFLPVDLSEHFGMGDIIPGTDLFKAENAKDKARHVLNVMGPQMQLVTRTMDAYDAAASGNWGKAGTAIAPNFIKRPAQGLSMLDRGASTDLQGRKVADTTTFDAIAKMAGGATAHTNEQAEMREEVAQAVGTAQDKQMQIVNLWARGIAQGSVADVQAARAALTDWNEKNPETRIVITPQTLMAQIKQMRLDANTRAILAAPKGLKADAVSTLRGGEGE